MISVLPEKTWDLCVVGGGFMGWCVAAKAIAKGRKVLLLERGARHGGRYAPEARQGFQFGAGFVYGDTTAWKAFSEQVGLGLEWIPVPNGTALVHGPKGWAPAKEELPEWEQFTAQELTHVPVGGMPAFLKNLRQFCETQGDVFYAALEAPVAEVHVNGEEGIEKLILGSGQEVRAKDYVWTADSKSLLDALRGNGLPEEGVARVAWMKKFTKTHGTPAVILEFAHTAPVADFTETMLLPFTAGEKEERRFLSGAFVSQRDSTLAPQGKQLSTWICALNETEWDDNHETMKKIRSARRILEKAFVGFEKTIGDERVLVMENSFTPVGKKKGDWRPLLDNLFLMADWSSPYGAHLQGFFELLADEATHEVFTPHAG